MDGPNTQKGTKEGFQGALDLFILFDETNSYSKICYIIYHIWGFVNVIFHNLSFS